MNIFKWNRPKETIKKVLLLFSYILLFLAFLIGTFAFIWSTYPKFISNFDKKIPDYYSKKVMKLYTDISKQSGTSNKLNANYLLLDYLDNISDYDKHIDKKIYAYRNIVKILNHDKKYDKALHYATKWNDELPNDIDSYILKANTLKNIDVNNTGAFLEKAYDRFYDVTKLHNYYINFLFETKNYEKLRILENEFNKYYSEHLQFYVYYATKDKPEFSQDKIIYIKDSEIHYKDNLYIIEISENFINLERLRLVVSNTRGNEILGSINLEIKHNKQIITKDLADFIVYKTTKINNQYALLEDKSYFDIDFKNSFKKKRGKFDINIIMSIENKLNYFLKKGTLAKNFNIASYVSIDNTSDSNVLNNIAIDNNTLRYMLNIQKNNVKLLNFDVKNTDIYNYKNIALYLNGILVPKNEYTVLYNNIEKNETGFFIMTSTKTYIQFKFDTPRNLKDVEIVLYGDSL